MGQKVGGGCCALFVGELGLHLTVWPGRRPISVPSGILIHPTVWPQYTNVTDSQTDRHTGQTGQRSRSVGLTVTLTVDQKSAAIPFRCAATSFSQRHSCSLHSITPKSNSCDKNPILATETALETYSTLPLIARDMASHAVLVRLVSTWTEMSSITTWLKVNHNQLTDIGMTETVTHILSVSE